ncbi:MAG: hypothetical protein V1893_01405 [Candidatus Omnitrophota bacterium]
MRYKILVIFLLIIGVAIMCTGCGNSADFKYETYSGKDPALDITMDYIAGWQYTEHRSVVSGFAQVSLVEFPEKKGKILRAGMSVAIKESTKVKVASPTVENVTEDLIEKTLKFSNAKVVSQTKTKLLDEKAIDVLFSYKTLDKFHRIKSTIVPVKERIIICKKNNKFYTVRYINTAGDFDRCNKAFSHIIKTIKLK